MFTTMTPQNPAPTVVNLSPAQFFFVFCGFKLVLLSAAHVILGHQPPPFPHLTFLCFYCKYIVCATLLRSSFVYRVRQFRRWFYVAEHTHTHTRKQSEAPSTNNLLWSFRYVRTFSYFMRFIFLLRVCFSNTMILWNVDMVIAPGNNSKSVIIKSVKC